ncbi:hypothetical protein NQ317_008169 [Molorchus minor]|uniref:Uncharacterized protein n=1 Tax=Molorchus minor TaxID=1323400 RepID=A0ABQ9JID4_9CUCU|nr:hypothetical protein NQ317_008169 [Molorchus minor]
MPIVSEITVSKRGLRPILVEFQNGKVRPGEEHNLKSAVYKTKDKKTVVGVANNNMIYTGIVDNKNDLYNNFILIHNRKNGKVRLIQTDCCTVSPILEKNNILDISTKSANNSVSELNKQFGSKKTKRNTEQQERLKMNIDTVKEQLERTVSGIHIDETDFQDSTPSENDSLYQPKINRQASTVEQVYNLADLVPNSVLDSLEADAENIANNDSLGDYNMMPFSSLNIAKILESSSGNRLKKIKIFLYIHFLIKFINTPVRSITKKFIACDISTEVNNNILDNYSIITGNVRTRPLIIKDKALCSILVMSAIALDYEVDVEPLTKDMKIGIKKVLEISRVLAFTTSTKNKTVIVLKLPLPAPVTVSTKKRRK